MEKPRSDKLRPEFSLPSGARLKEMAQIGWALAEAQAKEQAARQKPQSRRVPKPNKG